MITIAMMTTIISLFLLTIKVLWNSLRRTDDTIEEPVWKVTVYRSRAVKPKLINLLHRKLTTNVGLCEGTYILKNRLMFSDIYVDSDGGPPVKIYLNIEKKSSYMSVLKGCILIDAVSCNADPSKRIAITESKLFRIGDVIVKFTKGRQ